MQASKQGQAGQAGLIRPHSGPYVKPPKHNRGLDIPIYVCIILHMNIIGGLLTIWLLVVFVRIAKEDAEYYREDLTKEKESV